FSSWGSTGAGSCGRREPFIYPIDPRRSLISLCFGQTHVSIGTPTLSLKMSSCSWRSLTAHSGVTASSNCPVRPRRDPRILDCGRPGRGGRCVRESHQLELCIGPDFSARRVHLTGCLPRSSYRGGRYLRLRAGSSPRSVVLRIQPVAQPVARQVKG